MIDKTYHDLNSRQSSEGNARRCAEGEVGLRDVVARSMLMHHGMPVPRPEARR